ncbi:hypothetical protein SAY87_028732 [Trapa incisa]|uniref:Uncharacterized protein n=1 Tax=Trapa incisa TaxID=236973 RepID=A0AAN7KPN4_9MYRT|nr:hypothetical protein SAY87_028732 [Trapa incisa]
MTKKKMRGYSWFSCSLLVNPLLPPRQPVTVYPSMERKRKQYDEIREQIESIKKIGHKGSDILYTPQSVVWIRCTTIYHPWTGHLRSGSGSQDDRFFFADPAVSDRCSSEPSSSAFLRLNRSLPIWVRASVHFLL